VKPEIPIRIAIRSVDGLLDRDGSPLAGPRLHPDVARAIRSEAAAHPRGATFRIEVVVPPEDAGRREEVAHAIRCHFLEECAAAGEELRSIASKGRWSFGLAMLVVAVLFLINEAVLRLGEGRIVSLVSESLIIVAWVTLWGPAELLFFSRFPVRRERNLARALAAADVVLTT
jgi:hypothetical protein